MNTIIDFINMQWVANLGWSLLHTLWQGALITFSTLAILRFIPTSKSTLRYALSVGSMTTVVILFVVTFIYLQLNNSYTIVFEQAIQSPLATDQINFIAPLPDSIPSLFVSAVAFLNTHIYKIIIFWLTGATFLFTRLIGAFWYIEKLRNNSTFLSGTVLEHLNQLAYQLQIPRWIDLAESKAIQSPMVIGFLKPIILVPTGMLTGLSPEQIESIFIHELTHIKRHDYLVNLVQSIIEVVLFFNPFVIMLSNVLRKERENICDDVVLERLNNPALYAQTLAQLEEYKYNQLTISFAGNKNHLLNRIKRIMEQTAKKQNARGRFLPIILLVVGLISASWLSFAPEKQERKKEAENEATEIPTVSISLDTITPMVEAPLFPKPFEPMEVEAFEMDFEPGGFDFDHTFDFTLVPVFEIPVIEMHPFEFEFPPMEFNFSDTIPPMHWEKSGEEFSKNFNEKYSANLEALNRSMEVLQKNLSELRYNEVITQQVQEKIMQAEKIQQEKLKNLQHLQQIEVLELQQKNMKEVEAKLRHIEAINQEKLAAMEVKMKAMEKSMKAYEKELKEELVKDGYIKNDEEVNIHWKGDNLEINGKEIKEKDKQKYKDLKGKYFKEGKLKPKFE